MYAMHMHKRLAAKSTLKDFINITATILHCSWMNRNKQSSNMAEMLLY